GDTERLAPDAPAGVTAPCQLFRNNGDGTFTDVAAAAGVTNDRYTKSVVWGDYDGDRYPDLYVSNIMEPN
ncbi:MAG: VCBS repeat-containing protein, partial [Gemmatimonadetes bacterium]|nr:VCBS repeat-containing protein [Actinomycetota bacterium]NIS03211.1 VCBS repeat-containing protein [Gemmatimonadota bacterium]